MINFQVYSAKQYRKTGSGLVQKNIDPSLFNYDLMKIKEEKTRIRDEQKRENFQYKVNRKNKKINKPYNFRAPKMVEGVEVETEVVRVGNEKVKIIKGGTYPTLHTVDLILDKDTGNSCVLFGSGKRGKTTLMMYLYDKYYDNNKYISTLYCLNPQIDLYKKQKDLLVYPGFDSEGVSIIQSHHIVNKRTDNKYKFVEMFDDIVDSKHSKIVNELILTYRNSDISCMICLQYIYLLSKQNRGTVNNVFIFGFNTDEASHEIIKTYLKGFFIKMGLLTDDDRLAFFKSVTENHGFIYLQPATSHISFHRLNKKKKSKSKK